MSDPEAKKVRRKLDRQQFFKLCSFIQGDSARFLAENPKLSKTSEEATRALGFTCTAWHINQAQEAVGIVWRHESKVNRQGESTYYREERIRIITDAVTHLYEACGEKLPKEFSDMLSRRHSNTSQGKPQERIPTHGRVDVPIV